MPFDFSDPSSGGTDNWWDQIPQNGGFQDSTGVTAPNPFVDTVGGPGLQTSLSPDELNTPYGPDTPPGLNTSPGASGASSAASTIQKLLSGGGGQNPANLASLLGSLSSGIKANRIDQGNFTQKYDQQALADQTGRNQTESDALKKLAQTSYLMNGGSKFNPAPLSLNGKTYAPANLGYGPSPASAAQQSGAASLQGQLGARLAPGGTVAPSPLSSYAVPGPGENLASGLGAGLGLLGGGLSALGLGGGGGGTGTGTSPNGATGATGGTNPIGTALGLAGTVGSIGKLLSGASGATGAGTSGAMGALGTAGSVLSKALPLAGAATGAYGLYKNPSVGSDVMSGAGSGASIGSFAGPIGTGIGAGVGAIVGLVRGLTSVTGKELGGRQTQANIVGNLTGNATPQQQQEAASAGWPDPKEALSLIVMRDALTKSGVPPASAESQAEQAMHSLWDAEKSGSDAVNSAYSPIQAMMAKG